MSNLFKNMLLSKQAVLSALLISAKCPGPFSVGGQGHKSVS